MTPQLAALRDKKAEELSGISKRTGIELVIATSVHSAALQMFNYALEALEKMAPAFDEVAAHMVRREWQFRLENLDLIKKLMDRPDLSDMMGFLDGARWQHAQLSARVALAEQLLIDSEAKFKKLHMHSEEFEAELAELKRRLAEVDPLIPKALLFESLIEKRDELEAKLASAEAEIERLKNGGG